jgi:hypothetical protein
MSGASSVSPDAAPALLAGYLETHEPNDLFAAFGTAKDALAATPPESRAYIERVRTLADVMFASFDLTGGFSVIDCGIEMRRREAAFAQADDDSGEIWALRHPSWQGGTFSRALADPAWTLHHPDGRRSQIWKDWTSWSGEAWPMGWQVRRPDGVTMELEEDQWGDSWQFDPTGPPPDTVDMPELPPVEALIGRAERLRSDFLQTGDAAALEEALRLARSAVERTREAPSLTHMNSRQFRSARLKSGRVHGVTTVARHGRPVVVVGLVEQVPDYVDLPPPSAGEFWVLRNGHIDPFDAQCRS